MSFLAASLTQAQQTWIGLWAAIAFTVALTATLTIIRVVQNRRWSGASVWRKAQRLWHGWGRRSSSLVGVSSLSAAGCGPCSWSR